MHVGPVIRPADIERALQLLAAEKPDLVLLGGDLVCESPRYIDEATAVVGDFVASSPLGAFAVLGNHDYSTDARRLRRTLERQGIRVLRNEAARVCRDGHELWLAGIDDAMLGSPDPSLAFADIPRVAPAVALWHEPDWADCVAPYRPIVQLSGHSHGGQIRLPFLGTVAAPAGGRRFVAGLNQADGMPVYTSRGVGVYRPPVRLRCAPEVTLVTVSGSDDGAGRRGHDRDTTLEASESQRTRGERG
jgi:predicted MPP superfamily phosphohydrolase